MSSYWQDPDFQNRMVSFLCRDRNFLKNVSYLLEADDFKPRKHEDPYRWIVATSALEYYRKYRDNIGDMLRSEMLDFARKQRYAESQKKGLLSYVRVVQESELRAVDSVTEKVIEFKQEKMKMDALEQLMELQSAGELTTDKWISICKEAVLAIKGNQYRATDIFSMRNLEKRIDRRSRQEVRKFPYIFIDPVDENIRLITRGQLGLVMGPYKKGKSLCLVHIGVHTALQGLNVLYFTLEDSKEDVEDRIDAMVSALPIKRLHEMPIKLRNRFQQYKRLVRGRMKVIDGTGGGMTLERILECYERERNQGFDADVVVIDYDDEIEPTIKRKERRMEFADIYRELGQFLRKNQLIGWTAAQTVRNSENKKVIGGNTIAEDISKIRKVHLAIGLGQGDWGDDSLYIFIAAHKNDRQKIGWNIMTDRDRMIFYDRDATREMMKTEKKAAEEDQGDEEP